MRIMKTQAGTDAGSDLKHIEKQCCKPRHCTICMKILVKSSALNSELYAWHMAFYRTASF